MDDRAPFFSIVITAYNREECIERCIDSCVKQSFPDFEIIVVDDASSDRTVEVISSSFCDQVRLIQHPDNRGISPARHTGVNHALGKWIVIVDSDWELLEYCLDRLAQIIASLPDDIRVVRSRMQWDTGRVTPAFVPKDPIDYEGRIKWVEAESGTDALMCVRRDVFSEINYEANRRGGLEGLFQLNLARLGRIWYVEDILSIQHSDASNSILRGRGKSSMMASVKNAPDKLWMCEELLRIHGAALQKWGPNQYYTWHRVAALQCFYLGKRFEGTRYIKTYLSSSPADVGAWIVLFLGMLGPKATFYGHMAKRYLAR